MQTIIALGVLGLSLAAAPPQTQQNRQATEELLRALENADAHREFHRLNWREIFQKRQAELNGAATPKQYAHIAAELLAQSRDPHIWLVVEDAVVPAFQRNVSPNFKAKTTAPLVPGWKNLSRNVAVGRFPDGIGYLLIASWRDSEGPAIREALSLLEDPTLKSLILDVRPNSGGNEVLAREVASRFVRDPVVYARRRVLHRGELQEPTDAVLQPHPGRRFEGRTLVLMGPSNMSSTESFLLMMKRAGAGLVGARSYGASGNPMATNLSNGVAVHLPTWKLLTPGGDDVEGKGTVPDHEVAASAEDFARGDPVLAAALQLLRTARSAGAAAP